jgi:hypothetical protein
MRREGRTSVLSRTPPGLAARQEAVAVARVVTRAVEVAATGGGDGAGWRSGPHGPVEEAG